MQNAAGAKIKILWKNVHFRFKLQKAERLGYDGSVSAQHKVQIKNIYHSIKQAKTV